MPLVVLNDPSVGPEVWTVQTDNVHGGHPAARHLIELGRRRLVFVGPDDLTVVRQRFEGVERAVPEAGGAVTLERVQTPGVRGEDDRRVGDELLARPAHDRPDGVVAGAHLLAWASSSLWWSAAGCACPRTSPSSGTTTTARHGAWRTRRGQPTDIEP
jgi:LacI family transcriptional regulator